MHLLITEAFYQYSSAETFFFRVNRGNFFTEQTQAITDWIYTKADQFFKSIDFYRRPALFVCTDTDEFTLSRGQFEFRYQMFKNLFKDNKVYQNTM